MYMCVISMREFAKRFAWLSDELLPYLQNWESTIINREGGFLKKDRSKMFLSHQTYEGLQITVHSVIETFRYLLKNGIICFDIKIKLRLCRGQLWSTSWSR